MLLLSIDVETPPLDTRVVFPFELVTSEVYVSSQCLPLLEVSNQGSLILDELDRDELRVFIIISLDDEDSLGESTVE